MNNQDTQTRTDRLAEAIADAIMAGGFQPGAKLDEQMLAERYGVSRTPVREALRQVAATGLIALRPRRSAIVATVTPAELETLFGAMAELEATCARMCAISMTPMERRRLEALHGAMQAMVAAGDAEAYTDANQTFHSQIYAGTHNAVIAEMTANMRRRLSPFRRAQFRAPGRLSLSHAEHGAVLQAILAARAAEAHATMLHHVSLVEDAYEQLVEQASARLA
ncbi:GntR family transcriptional regulator [Propylenella binzhouense]|uniref:GntR family transcriptional regulator n=1 Tax=Propylenella binzhouense TaxID=2555902 RepID=A0A964WU63_9HYPH|nr:GntR family transcriptional regulator [Propylenella binzhouense]MYZ48772.1 GntR family transcriptional regulator [Propylenella binzhouense]